MEKFKKSIEVTTSVIKNAEVLRLSKNDIINGVKKDKKFILKNKPVVTTFPELINIDLNDVVGEVIDIYVSETGVLIADCEFNYNYLMLHVAKVKIFPLCVISKVYPDTPIEEDNTRVSLVYFYISLY